MAGDRMCLFASKARMKHVTLKLPEAEAPRLRSVKRGFDVKKTYRARV
jgi:hypothetical protein